MDREYLTLRLREVTVELGQLHRELATVRVAEARCRTEAWRRNHADGLLNTTDAERSAKAEAIDFTCDIYIIQGNIAALTEDKVFMLAALADLAQVVSDNGVERPPVV